MKSNNVILLNRQNNPSEGLSTFTVWSDFAGIIAPIARLVRPMIGKDITNVPDSEHWIGQGYWLDITVRTEVFETVVSDIKKSITEKIKGVSFAEDDFKQTTWAADMLVFA